MGKTGSDEGLIVVQRQDRDVLHYAGGRGKGFRGGSFRAGSGRFLARLGLRGGRFRFVGRKTVPLPAEEDFANPFWGDVGAAGIDRFVDGGGDPGPAAGQLRAAAFARGKIEAFRQLLQDLALGAGGLAAIGIGETA